MTVQLSRRGFLKGASAGAAALVIGLNSNGLLAAGHGGDIELNPFVSIDEHGIVSVMIKHFEMGQGTTTGLATLVAEELDADWANVKSVFPLADDAKYGNLFFKIQGTGGSTAIANSFMQYREAGAMARALLVEAAAKKWNVPSNSLTVSKGVISVGSKSATFGELVAEASKLTPPAKVTVKSPNQFTLIGKADLPRKDSTDKTDGSAIFAMDVKVPNMVYAVIARSPKFGGTVVSFDKSEASKVTGFVDAMALPNKAGVAVFAKNTWSAMQSREALSIEWDFSTAETRSSEEMYKTASQQMDKPDFQVTKDVSMAQAADAIKGAAQTVEAEFSFPFLAHAPMEPLNLVIEPTETGVRVHDGCQFPGMSKPTIAQVLQIPVENVEIETVYAGGSFGRRATPNSDYHVEAALAFLLLGKKKAVKLIYTREDDIKGGAYRPIAGHRATVGLDESGNITGWDHRIVAKSILKGTFFESMMVHDGVDHVSVEGASDTLYDLPNQSVGLSDFITPIPALWWRSVGHTHTAFAMESLLDMAAEKAGRDPVELRLSLLNGDDPRQKRLAGVIKKAAEAANWKNPNGRILGFASHFSFNSYVATIADISVNGTDIHVNKLYVAVDCGVAVNPDVIKAQMEGGSGYGLGAIMRNEITLTDGVVDQENFPDYETLRMSDMPEVEVHIIASNEAPTGVGEPATPPVGPAVANAIFKGTGTRITQLPMTKAGFSFV